MANRDKGTAMSSRVDEGGHYAPSQAPKLKKGIFQQVGTFVGEGDMTTVEPKGTSVNVKTGKTQVGGSEF